MEIKIQKRNLKLKTKKPDLVRSLSEMKDVVYDKKWLKTAKNFNVYYVWRGVKEEDNTKTSASRRTLFPTSSEIRYDITIIPPRMLGKEFPKTKGHRHLDHFQELIQVLEGKAFYFAQKSKDKDIEECYAVEAEKGDFVIIPQDVDHLTINPGKENLVMANWMYNKVRSDYGLFEKLQGACYYYTKSGWLKNKKYGKIPKLAFKKPLKSLPGNLDFLK